MNKKILISFVCLALILCGCSESSVSEAETDADSTPTLHWAGDEDGDNIEFLTAILSNDTEEHLAGDEDGDTYEYIIQYYELAETRTSIAADDEENEPDGENEDAESTSASTSANSASVSTESTTKASSEATTKSSTETTTKTSTEAATTTSPETATSCSHSYTYTYSYSGDSCIKTGTCSKCGKTTTTTSSHNYTTKTKTVHHDAETQDVIACYVVCSQCKEVLGTTSDGSQAAALCNAHIASSSNSNCTSWTYQYEVVDTIVVSEAYDETITYQVCTNCGYTKE